MGIRRGSPLTLAFVRVAIGSIALLTVVRLACPRRAFRRRDLLGFTALVVAVCYLGLGETAAAWYLWYKGREYVDASVVSAFFFAQPVAGAVFGALFLGERLGPRFVLGGVVMAAGIYLVATTRTDRTNSRDADAARGTRSENA